MPNLEKQIVIRIETDTYRKLLARAEREDRSPSAMARTIIKAALKREK